MYSLPSTSHTRAPCALLTKNGCPPTARNARTGELTPPGMYFNASANNASDCAREIIPTRSCLPIPLCNGNTAAHPERLARHLQSGRGLAALVFVQINQSNDSLHSRFLKAAGNDFRGRFALHHVSLENRVEYFVRRQRILVGLVRT